MLAGRAAIAERYNELLADVDGVETPAPDIEGDYRTWFVYVVRLAADVNRNAVMAALQARGIACKPYLPAAHLQPFYRSLGHREGECPVAEAIARSTLALPFHTRLDEDDQAYVADALGECVAGHR
jgi:perosamine synthetase